MTIEEALANVSTLADDDVLVARSPLTWAAEARFVKYTYDYRIPADVLSQGYKYLLGRDDLIDILEFAKTKKLGSRSVAEFLIHYCVNDVFPAWIDDIPDA
jgi:hypothetical protein